MKRTVLLVALAAGLAAQSVHAAPPTYQEFLDRARALHAGETRRQIVAVLGKPAAENTAHMTYVLTGLKGFPGMPGAIGMQVFPEAEIPMHDGRMAGQITWAWMDTIGSAPTPRKPR